MSDASAVNTLLTCAMSIPCAVVAGLGLAQYADGGAFSFYKQSPAAWPEYSMSQAPRSDWSYPIDPVASQVAAGGQQANPIDALYRDDAVVRL
ncbi:hypothetical protein [Sphingomonas sp.]|uniref:hypothetical protein n=1 Tax=Sphingomonas sp. TaxID=28214 RepID=UPI002EDB003F